jgi:hypothetical protein
LTQYQPLPNLNNGDGNNFVDETPDTNRNDAFSTRIDHQFRDRSQLSARYTYNGEQNIIAGSFPLRPTDERVRAQQAALSYTYSGASWLNETRFSFTRMSMYDTPESAFQSNVIQQLGVEGLTANPANYGLPYFQLADYSLVTDDPTLPQVQRDNLWNLSDSVSWTRAAHTIKTGVDWIHFQLNYQQNELARGSYTYTGAFTSADGTPGPTGDAMADFLLGFPQDTSRNEGNTQAYLRQNSFGGFVQDDWRVSPRLTLNLGLRYEYVTPYTETRGDLLNLVYGAGPSPPPPQLERVSQAVSPDTRNFAPRVGLAWRLPQLPFSKGETVFRAGYGIYYSPEIAVEVYDLVLNGILVQNNITDGSQAPILTTRNGFPQTASTGLPTYFGIDPHAPTPYMQQWNAGFQHEFAGHILGEVSYVGSKGTHLGRFRQFNTPLQTETGADLCAAAGRFAIAAHVAHAGGNHPAAAHRQFVVQRAAGESREAPDRARIAAGELCVVEIHRRRRHRDSGLLRQFGRAGRKQPAAGAGSIVVQRGAAHQRRICGRSAGRARLRAGAAQLAVDRNDVTLQDGMPLNIFYYAFDPANTGLPNRPNIVPGSQLDVAARPAHATNEFFNTAAFTRARALYVWRCRTKHREWSRQQHLRHGAAPPVRHPGARRAGIPRRGIQYIQSSELGSARDVRRFWSAVIWWASWAWATPAACSSQFGTISK